MFKKKKEISLGMYLSHIIIERPWGYRDRLKTMIELSLELNMPIPEEYVNEWKRIAEAPRLTDLDKG